MAQAGRRRRALYELGDETAAVEMYRRARELAAVVFTRRAPCLLACGRTVPVDTLVGDPAEPGPVEAALCGACNAATTAEVPRESGVTRPRRGRDSALLACTRQES
jgi:hypothetical protein